ncbi:hypothetical protein ACJX0J_006034, partial [Zea mays]
IIVSNFQDISMFSNFFCLGSLYFASLLSLFYVRMKEILFLEPQQREFLLKIMRR